MPQQQSRRQHGRYTTALELSGNSFQNLLYETFCQYVYTSSEAFPVECIRTGSAHNNVSSGKALRGETEIEINDLPPIGGQSKEVPSVAEAEFMARTPRPTTPRPVIYG